MQLDRFTIKSQEALQAAIGLAAERRNTEVQPEHLLPRCSTRTTASSRPSCARSAPRPDAIRARRRRRPRRPADDHRRRARARQRPRAARRAARRRARGRQAARRVRLHRAPAARALRGARRRPRSRATTCSPKAVEQVRGPHRVTDQRPRGEVPGAREVRPRPHRGGRGGQARPGDRPRRRDPPRDPGPLPPHQEQPGADRRARRRQDRDRRGPRPADRRRRRARSRCATAASSRSTSARCWPAPSTAASSRSA